ncbi:hypothetical protein NS226_17830 [Aureimonas ureilytica]|uniref:Late control protein D n=1 Tax=Aureimonas ureilytica TaxID=401562 RepID=A0A175R4Y2_9HYPH|nr:contractile injection system protein, VgrG/Pvc8 family [Aureimonas ureilytica]KTQ86763.1 hypothetical protein NS226_17830 [Aureimonas ureilytica]
MKAVYRVAIEGKDITSSLAPLLQTLSLSDKSGTSSDTLDIVLDDRDGQIAFPKAGVEIAVFFGWERDGEPPLRFVGTVDECEARIDRGSGSTISVRAQGINAKGREKAEDLRSWDDATFETVIKDAAKDAGLGSVKIDPDLAKISRPYWFQGGESFIAFGERLSEEVGGTFKVQGQAVTITKRGSGKSASGKTLPTIRAERGINLHAASITPQSDRSRYKAVRARYYDREKARYRDVEVEIDDSEVDAVKTIQRDHASETEARTSAEATAGESERQRGGGSITIEGNGDATPEGRCEVIGARPGIDGTYTIVEVSHEISRGSGWTTTLTVRQPGGDAGKDKRKAKEKPDGSSSSATDTSSTSSYGGDDRLKPASSHRLGFAGPTLQV